MRNFAQEALDTAKEREKREEREIEMERKRVLSEQKMLKTVRLMTAERLRQFEGLEIKRNFKCGELHFIDGDVMKLAVGKTPLVEARVDRSVLEFAGDDSGDTVKVNCVRAVIRDIRIPDYGRLAFVVSWSDYYNDLEAEADKCFEKLAKWLAAFL